MMEYELSVLLDSELDGQLCSGASLIRRPETCLYSCGGHRLYGRFSTGRASQTGVVVNRDLARAIVWEGAHGQRA